MKLIGALRSDFKRLFQSPGFYLSVLAVAAIVFLNVWPEAAAAEFQVSLYYLANARGGMGAFFMAMTVVIVLPFGLSHWEDARRNYIHCLEARAGLHTCGWSHVIVAAAGAFLAVFMGYLLCFGCLAIKLPAVTVWERENMLGYLSLEDMDAYARLAASGKPVLYLMAVFATEAAGYAFLSVFALMVSAKVRNRFLLLSVPLMLYYGSMLFSNISELPGIFRWYYYMDNGGAFATMTENALLTVVCVFAYFGSLIILEGLVFTSWMSRRG